MSRRFTAPRLHLTPPALLTLTLLVVAACGMRGDEANAAAGVCDRARAASDIQLGQFHSCALLCDGRVRCWGDNSFGQLGLGDRDTRGEAPAELGVALPSVDLGTQRRAVGLSLGHEHSCAWLDDGTVKCWGANGSGQLGLGDTNERGSEPGQMGDALSAVDLGTSVRVVKVAAGGSHTCALLDGGTIKCWGTNYFGQLGLGDTALRGDEPGDMGAALQNVDLGTQAVAVDVVAGQDHTCVLLQGGSVKCWGDNSQGRLGLGDTANRGDAAFEMGDALPAVDVDEAAPVRTLAAHGGASHSCALLDGRVKCWGNNAMGELGLGDSEDRGADRAGMGDQLPRVDLGGQRARAIGVGSGVSCAILEDHSARCWGYNGYAALGLGDTRNRGEAPESMGKNLPAIALGAGRRAVVIRPSGGNHTCALLDDGSIKCWGASSRGQLGQGHGNTVGDGPDEMGDALPAVDLRTQPSATP